MTDRQAKAMQTYILTLNDKQERQMMEDLKVKTRRNLAHELKATRVLWCCFQTWTVIVADNADGAYTTVTWADTWQYIRAYLTEPRTEYNKPLLSRLASVLTRLFTCSLKPSQVPSS